MTPVSLYPGAARRVFAGGTPVTAIYGPVLGGMVTNPLTNTDQGLTGPAEPLFADLVGPAALMETGTTVQINPGATFKVPANFAGQLSVNAKSSGHRFSSVVFQPPTQPTPTPAPSPDGFPPSAATTLTEVVPSYLYQQYNDDQDLQAFVNSFNVLAQEYAAWFASVNLPDYRGLAGGLLDWVALGLYGMARPSLSSGHNTDRGPLNTYQFDQQAFNTVKRVGPQNVTVTSDDTFKRILTWALYRGDGRYFNIRWLKRRVKRFLVGVNGSAPNVDQTYDISVTVGSGIVTIGITLAARRVLRGVLNNMAFDVGAFNSLVTAPVPGAAHYPNETVFKSALLSGALEFPFQYQATVQL